MNPVETAFWTLRWGFGVSEHKYQTFVLAWTNHHNCDFKVDGGITLHFVATSEHPHVVIPPEYLLDWSATTQAVNQILKQLTA